MWQRRAEETEASHGQRGRRKMGFKEEGAAKTAHCWGTRVGVGERERGREKDISRAIVWAMRRLPVAPVDSTLESRAKPEAAAR